MRRRRRPTLHHAVKDKRVTVLGPVKQPEMDFMSHRGYPPPFPMHPCQGRPPALRRCGALWGHQQEEGGPCFGGSPDLK